MSLQSIKSLLLDKELRGLWISLGAHGLVLLIIFAGIEFSSPDAHISPINAVQAVAIDNRSENRKKLEEQKQAQRKKDKAKKVAEEKRKQEKLKREKLKKEELKKEKLKQEKIKQEKQAVEAKKKLIAKQKLEAKKMAEAKKRAKAKKAAEQKAEAKRKADVARKQAEAEEFERQQQEEQRLLDAEKRQEKLRAEQAAKEAAARARQEDIDRAIYQQEIARYMTQHWIKPPNTKKGYVCEVLITQSRAGHVLNVKLVACMGDAAFRASVERAANKPDQLPLPRNPAVFERDVRISFEEK